MSKSILKVTIEPCGTRAKDRTEKIYPINFMFSNPEKQLKRGTTTLGIETYQPGSEFRAQLLASGEIEIL